MPTDLQRSREPLNYGRTPRSPKTISFGVALLIAIIVLLGLLFGFAYLYSYSMRGF